MAKQLKSDQCREKTSTSKTKSFILGAGRGLYRTRLWLHSTVRVSPLGEGAETHPDLLAGGPKSMLWSSILITEGLRWVFRSLVSRTEP